MQVGDKVSCLSKVYDAEQPLLYFAEKGSVGEIRSFSRHNWDGRQLGIRLARVSFGLCQAVIRVEALAHVADVIPLQGDPHSQAI